MPLRVLYIGGTGEVSYGCIEAGLRLGQEITVFNRGASGTPLPKGARHIAGDLNDRSAYAALGKQKFDAVCQFRSFSMEQCERDIETFAGNTGQFVFISTAMVYSRPPKQFRVDETVAKGNPHSPNYAQKKLAIEQRLMELHRSGKMPATIVRPSHTIRQRYPSNFNDDLHLAWRLRRGKPVIVHGDGSSLWTVTRTEDFGWPFARLLGNARALGEDYHITSDESQPWEKLFEWFAEEMGVPGRFVHVASDTLGRYHAPWIETLAGDKSASMAFDNSKVKDAAGGWECKHTIREALSLSTPHVRQRLKDFEPDPQMEALMDRIVTEQQALGA